MYGRLAETAESNLDVMHTWSDDKMMSFLDSMGALDLDETWNIVFAMIDSMAWPASMMKSARPIGGHLEYGPAMSVDADTVAEIGSAIAYFDDASIEAAFTAPDVGDYYPGIFEQPGPKQWAVDMTKRALGLIMDAAGDHNAVVFAVV